mgnify:CR=1 FL=1
MAFSGRSASARTILALGVSALALAGAPALAQDEPQEDAERGSNEIVVTAQFREQRLQDTPLAITAVNAEMMEARSQTQLSEVVRQAPSVDLRPQTGAWGPSISASIRGLGQADFNPALEPGVGLYIDDVYYPRLTGANFDLMDVERVEVLRGPQGTLTGRNSEGGAIKFFTRRPDGSTGGYVSGTYGSRNRINLRAAAEFALTDTLFGRVTGAYADQEGYVERRDYECDTAGTGPASLLKDGCVIEKLGDVGYRALRGTLRWVPTDAIDFIVSADYIKDVRNQSPEVLVAATTTTNPNIRSATGDNYGPHYMCGRFCNYAKYSSDDAVFQSVIPGSPPVNLSGVEGGDDTTFEAWGISGNLSVDLSDRLNVVSITAYREWDTEFFVDNDLSPVNSYFGSNRLDHWFFSQEVRLNVDLADFADLTVGGYYSDERTTYATLQDIRYIPVFPLQFIGDDPVNTDSKAVFGTVILNPVDRLTLTLGGRYTWEHKDYTFYRFNIDGQTINAFLDRFGAAYGIGYSGPDTADADGDGNTTEIVTALSGRTANYDGDRFDFRASVDYRFSDAVLAYATIASGFKGGGVVPRPFTAAQAAPFGVEEVLTYEAGIKTDLFDRRARFNVAAFYNDFTDQQLTLSNCPALDPVAPVPCAAPQNAGDSKQWGLEFELYAEPVDGLLIDAAASYLNQEFKCVNPAVVGLASGPCTNDPTVISRLNEPLGGWKWSWGVQYEADLGANGSVTPRFDMAHQIRLNGGVLPGPDIFSINPAYTISNARLTWRNEPRDLSVSLEVTNVFDKYYYVNRFDIRSAGVPGVPAQVGRPREWALTVKKDF